MRLTAISAIETSNAIAIELERGTTTSTETTRRETTNRLAIRIKGSSNRELAVTSSIITAIISRVRVSLRGLDRVSLTTGITAETERETIEAAETSETEVAAERETSMVGERETSMVETMMDALTTTSTITERERETVKEAAAETERETLAITIITTIAITRPIGVVEIVATETTITELIITIITVRGGTLERETSIATLTIGRETETIETSRIGVIVATETAGETERETAGETLVERETMVDALTTLITMTTEAAAERGTHRGTHRVHRWSVVVPIARHWVTL